MENKMIKKKIVVFTGAGISAESGLETFRDSDGLWENYPVDKLATKEGFELNTELVLNFYNWRKKKVSHAQPNQAHIALAKLESKFDVVIITQNVDDLHERAGSTNVIHLHGQLSYMQSSADSSILYDWGDKPILIGQLCELNSQLRPHIVLFGEPVLRLSDARGHIKTADKVLAIGSSLTVQPAASLLRKARFKAEKILITFDFKGRIPFGYKLLRGNSAKLVPSICSNWLAD